MKTMRKLIAVLFVLTMLASLSATAFAADGPSAADIEEVDTGSHKLTMPEASSYLPEYKKMYINAEEYLSLSGYSEPAEGEQWPRAVVFHGAEVTAIAKQDGFYCVLYQTVSLNPTVAWIPESFLSETYPGKTVTIGAKEQSGSPEAGHVASWSWERFPGTVGRYMLLTEPCENCTGFTLDYQVISYTVSEDKLGDIMGKRTVSIYDGEKWVDVGKFKFEELEPMHVVVQFDEPTTVMAVRTLVKCKQPDAFQARQNILDVYAAP